MRIFGYYFNFSLVCSAQGLTRFDFQVGHHLNRLSMNGRLHDQVEQHPLNRDARVMLRRRQAIA